MVVLAPVRISDVIPVSITHMLRRYLFWRSCDYGMARPSPERWDRLLLFRTREERTQLFAGAKRHCPSLLFRRFQLYEPHRRPCRRFRYRFGVDRVILLALH